jgi:hypothetical protein
LVDTLVSAVQSTPLPTILSLAGLLLIVLAVANKVSASFAIEPTMRRAALAIGLTLVIAGVMLFLFPRSDGFFVNPSEVVRAAYDAKSLGALEESFTSSPRICDAIGRAQPLSWFLNYTREHERLEERVRNDAVIWNYRNSSFATTLGLKSVDEVALAQIARGKIKLFAVYFPDGAIRQLRAACDTVGSPTLWDGIGCAQFLVDAELQKAWVSGLENGHSSPSPSGC